ncbi:GNAT family N-acetyltransferase [Prevotella sp. E9-3]|uniref:GNAT family N-acetyltransferase n=1 Tax=Prevotella sp. E9-3 TaxID=2913621 RepID=UPI001EDB117E|nr:GNAT family N-acetyltransferase [Prevotella sp. E9-3]UKK47133.1 GNAT family N-acetyltransferase [Prevotella sp. E9-3]
MKVEIISARPEDTDFIAWIVAQGMHMDGVPSFLKKHGARNDTLYSWQNTRLLLCDGRLAGGLISYDGATHEERRRNTWVMPNGKLLSSGDVPETTAGEYYLDSLAIVPEFRGNGLWRLLFDDAVKIAKEKGFHRVTLIYDEEYPKLAQLYTSYGFVPEDTFLYFDTLCRKMSLSI